MPALSNARSRRKHRASVALLEGFAQFYCVDVLGPGRPSKTVASDPSDLWEPGPALTGVSVTGWMQHPQVSDL